MLFRAMISCMCPASRRPARFDKYYSEWVHEYLPSRAQAGTGGGGAWTKGLELAKVRGKREGQKMDCAICLHKARLLPKDSGQYSSSPASMSAHPTLWPLPARATPAARTDRLALH